MKKNIAAVISILLTLALAGALAFLLVNGTFTKPNVPPGSTEYTVGMVLLGLVGAWIITAVAGYVTLLRRGVFADLMEKMVGYEYVGCIAGIFLLAGLWVIAVLPGPWLLWFATTRRQRPMCPKCKNWMPYGATRCAHCGALMSGEVKAQGAAELEAPAPMPKTPAEAPSSELPPGSCEKCREAKPDGVDYLFYYGTLSDVQHIDRRTTRYEFKVSGTQSVYLCNDCVSEYAKKRTRSLGLWFTLGMAAFMGAMFGCSEIMYATSGGSVDRIEFQPFMLVVLLLIPFAVLLSGRNQRRKEPLSAGDSLAIELRKPALKAQGYTRFFTRQQVKDRRLL